jgi:hypothetical protein
MVVWFKTFPFISKAWWCDLKHFVSSQKYNGLWHFVSSPKYIPFHLKRMMVSDSLFHLKSIWLNLKHFVSTQKYVVKLKTCCFTSRVRWFKTINSFHLNRMMVSDNSSHLKSMVVYDISFHLFSDSCDFCFYPLNPRGCNSTLTWTSCERPQCPC